MSRVLLHALLAIGAGLIAIAARAADDPVQAAPGAATESATAPTWTFGGFGTLGLVHADERQADFTSNILRANGPGFTRSWSPAPDSRLGAQLTLTMDRHWSGVLQVISEQGVTGNYRPVVEWANIKYQATPELSLRLGRIALPVFLAADYRKVAYAVPWVRTPVEVYDAIPISNSDGIDATYRWNSGTVKNTTQVFFGRTKVTLPEGASAFARSLGGISNTSEVGALSLRLSVLTNVLSVDLARPLFNAFRQFGPQGAALADTYDADHKRATGTAIGLNYDPGAWFAMAELGRLDANSFLGDKTAGYVSAGYRHKAFTPYLIYARVKSNGPTSDPGLSLAGLPPQLAGAAAFLNGGLNTLLKEISVQSTVSAGLRWDCAPNLAAKLQFDQVRPTDGTSGTLINEQPGFVSGRVDHVFSLSLDFVF